MIVLWLLIILVHFAFSVAMQTKCKISCKKSALVFRASLVYCIWKKVCSFCLVVFEAIIGIQTVYKDHPRVNQHKIKVKS